MTRALVGAGLGLLIAAACSSHAAMSTDAAAALGADTGLDRGAGGAAGQSDAPPDAQASPPPDVTFPDPPATSCDDAGACDFPAPACANLPCADGGSTCGAWTWVVYYDSPRCVNGGCVWDRRYFQCDNSTRCAQGGCPPNFTSVPISPL